MSQTLNNQIYPALHCIYEFAVGFKLSARLNSSYKRFACVCVQIAVADGCIRFNFAVLAWNQSSIDYYKRLGAVNMSELEQWHSWRIFADDMKLLAEKKIDVGLESLIEIK